MTIILAIFLGLIQGFTEFLPISSSGHLVLANMLFGTQENFVFLSILLHLATLLAVLVAMRKDVLYLIKHPFSKIAIKLYVATIPAVIFALIFHDFFETAFSGLYLPICFMISAVVLFLSEFVRPKKSKIGWKTSLIMGFSQALAVLPGISRSGTTICAGILCGSNRNNVTRFSFLMSIPIILGSMLVEILNISTGSEIINTPLAPTIVAFLVAFATGLVCVKVMLKYLQKIRLWYFSVYLVILSLLTLLAL